MAPTSSPAAGRAESHTSTQASKLAAIRTWVVAGLALFAAVCVAIGYLFLSGTQQNDGLPGTMTPSFEFRATLQKLVQIVQDAEGGVRGVILSGDQASYTTYRQRHQALAAHWTQVERLFDGHRVHGHDAAHQVLIAGLVRQKLAVMNGVVAARKSGGMAAAMALVNTGRGLALTAEITKAIQYPIAEEVLVAQSTLADQSAQIRFAANTGLLILLTFFIAVLAAAILILRLIARNFATEYAKEKARARLKEYAELASDWFWESDSDCVVRSVSMGGNSPNSIDLKQFVGVRMGIDRTPGIADDDWLMVSTAVRKRKPFRQFTFKVRDRAGWDHTLTSAGKPTLDTAGVFAGYIGTARDITAEIEARTALDEEKLKLVQALEVAPGGISIVDANGIFLGSNSEARDARTRNGQYSQPGRSYTAILAEAIARVGAEVAGDPNPPTGERLYERLRECGPPFEVRVGRRWYLVRSARLADDSLVVGSSDVTNMKAREEALTEARLLAQSATRQAQENETRFREFADASSDWFWETDNDLVVTSIVAGKNASLRIDTKPFLGARTQAFKPPGMSEADFLRRNEALAKREPYRDVRFQVTDSEQRVHTVSSSATPRFDPAGEFIGYRGTTRDVSVEVETRAAFDAVRKRFLEAIDAVPGLFVLLDAEGNYIASNAAASDIHRLNGSSLAPGARYADALQQLVDRAGLRLADESVTTSGETMYRRLKACGDPFDVRLGDVWLLVRSVALANGSLAATATDITALKAHERDLSQAKETAELASRYKSEFLATMSHELRNPLTSIIGALSIIVANPGGALPDKVARLMTMALDNSRRLVKLISEILDVEKIESGMAAFNVAPLKLIDTVRRATDAMRGLAASRGISILLDPDSLHDVIRGDPDRLQQVVINLLSNAIKFSPPNGEVVISIRQLGANLRLSVADRGPGIPQEFRNRIFARFAQAGGAATPANEGSGLGLSIAKSIIDQLGGTISFETEDGQGTIFHIDLPLIAPPPAHEEAA